MAVQLCLKDKETGRFYVGNDFIALDEEIAEHFNAVPDPVNWFRYWMNVFGFTLALGKDFDYVRNMVAHDPDSVAVVDYLASRFTNESYGCH